MDGGIYLLGLKNKKKINQIVTFSEYSKHKKKNFKTWRGLDHTYKKDWEYSYKLSCFLFSLISGAGHNNILNIYGNKFWKTIKEFTQNTMQKNNL